MSQPLPKPLRTQLENTVKAARDVAEKAAKGALAQLAVGEAKAPDYLSADQKSLRRRLRAHGRALGDIKHKDDTQPIKHLVWEIAYEHWHRMLFARFLAENGLLMWEPGAAVSLDDCRDMVDNHPDMAMGAKSQWELAGILAARMLPQVFKSHSPAFELSFAPEHQRELEKLLANLPEDVFKASDSLGWVYQFWQAKRKDEVNASEVKIGADELPAVTQLFTEPYMVAFLLHNSLGAWWQTRHPGERCPVDLAYLRTLEDGTPAAGKFEGWPDGLKDFKLLDPCCGSGHFIVAAFHLLVPMRMQAEGLSAAEAVDAVIADNLHGLEIDPRCVEIAAFALALAAWSYPDAGGYRMLPALNIACCGLKVSAKADDWAALVPDDAPHATLMRQELKLLHASMREAPLLGSLLDPWRSLRNDLATSDYAGLQALLNTALTQERASLLSDNEDFWDAAVSAQGLLDAARLLAQRYHLVITNVPYLTRGKQSEKLMAYCESHYFDSRADISTVFLERCLELCVGNGKGSAQIVMPQNWLFLASYKLLRTRLIKHHLWRQLAWLGYDAFQTPLNAAPILLSIDSGDAPSKSALIACLDVSEYSTSIEKSNQLKASALRFVSQSEQLRNPDTKITLSITSGPLLSSLAVANQGIPTSDSPLFVRSFWEQLLPSEGWEFFQGTVSNTTIWGGRESIVWYENGCGRMRELSAAQSRDRGRDRQGRNAWGKPGVAISLMGQLPASIYSGNKFDINIGVLTPNDIQHLPSIYAFCSSPEFNAAVRNIDKKLNVTIATLAKIPFDATYWQKVAAERYPNGLPKPYSDDPTQWIFHGHPKPTTDPLQVAIARLLGYRWPAETDGDMELSEEARAWIAETAKLASLADDDGIVCLPPVRGEKPAAERLLDLLIAAWGADWQQGTLDKLLAQADCAGKSLDYWLREKFFEQHAKRFHHRPFIWHAWDGLKDGFAALVNYHKLDAKNLERLIHTYLGDWIRQQEAGVRDKVDGAQQRLAAAQALKKKLEAILEGEAPYDIFVRWKPLDKQPIGWDPDLNDGVRHNIRPFMTAEVLRHNKPPKLNIKWDKDRGKDVESAPWFKVFKGDRINDHHLTLAEKKAAKS